MPFCVRTIAESNSHERSTRSTWRARRRLPPGWKPLRPTTRWPAARPLPHSAGAVMSGPADPVSLRPLHICEDVRPGRQARDRGGVTHHPGLLRTAPLHGETTSSLICRIASRYGLEAMALRSCWKWRSQQPRHNGGGTRADAEVLLNTAGRRLLAGLCGVEEGVLARALPSWGREDARLPASDAGEPAAAWRTGGAVAGPVAFGCRLCTARRTGTAGRAVLYAPRWNRVCPARAVAP